MGYKVTIVTTLFNYKNYIPETIESFLSQDFIESEMVIVDDGSTDGSKDAVLPYVRKNNERIRLFDLQKNYGYSTAKNVGIFYARSPILVMLDADDLLMKNGISSRYQTMINGGFNMVHAPALKLGKNNIISEDFYPASQRAKAYRKQDGYKLIHAQGVMIKKTCHDIVGMYDESMKCSSDKEMWARCLTRLTIGFDYNPCALYRIHSKQMHKSDWKMKNLNRLNKITHSKINSRRKSLKDIILLRDYTPPESALEIK